VRADWRQSVFYLPEALTVSAKEVVSGSISITPNAKNHRDLDFTLSYTHKGKVEGMRRACLEYKMR
jgi:protein arginine N-methyltransferase 1